ncbi:MAG: hypothetical protein ACK46J_01450 [Burkholderiales bacterium]
MIADTESTFDHNAPAVAGGTAGSGEWVVARGKLERGNLVRAL